MTLRIALLLFFLLTCTLHDAQILDEFSHGCNSEIMLVEYQKKDSDAHIKDGNILFHMAKLALRSERQPLSFEYLNRIIEQQTLKDQPVFYKALTELIHHGEINISFDSIYSMMAEHIDDDDSFHAAKLFETIGNLSRTSTAVQDSIISHSIQSIKDKKFHLSIIALSLQRLAKSTASKGNSQNGLKIARQAYHLVKKHSAKCSPNTYNSFINIGSRFSELQQADSALHYFQQAYDHSKTYSPKNNFSLFQAAINLSNAHALMHQPDVAISYLDSAARHIRFDTSADSATHLAHVYNQKAGLYSNQGKLDKSKQYYLKSIRQSEQSRPGDNLSKMASYANVASQLSKLGDQENSLHYLNNALSIARNLVGENHQYTAIILMKIGQVHFENKAYNQCEAFFNQSLIIRKKLFGSQHSSLANIYTNFAILYRDQNEYDTAIKFLDLANEIYVQNFGPKHMRVAETFNRKANINIRQKKYQNAKRDVENGLTALNCHYSRTPCAASSVYLDLLSKKAHVSINLSTTIDTTLNICRRGDTVFSELFRQTETIQDMSALITGHSSFYKTYIHALVLKHEASKDMQFLEQAYTLNNKVKNLALLKSLREHNQYMFASVPYEIRKLRTETIAKINKIERRIFELSDDNTKQKIHFEQLEQAHLELEKIDTEINLTYPSYSSLLHLDRDIPLHKVQAQLDSTEAIVDFVVLDSSLIIFILTAHHVRVVRMVDDPQLIGNLSNYIKSASQGLSLIEMQTTVRPFLKPLEELPEHITRLKIIPDDFLSTIPFEVLPYQDGYLINRFSISYANSVHILLEQKHKEKPNNKYHISIFAPDYTNNESAIQRESNSNGNNHELSALPHALEEANFIHSIYSGIKYIGRQANKEHLKIALDESDIIHLTMHAEINDDRPLYSQLVFQSDTTRNTENLYLHQLYDLSSNAQLVVLSACETGIGTFHAGDGVRSLANGFQYAGIPSVVLSLWKVPDQSTSIIMKSFYQYLKNGDTKDTALKKAKLAYLNNTVSEKLRHPYFWGGFVAVGNMDTIVTTSQKFPLPYILVGLIILVLLYIVNKKLA